ncbi:hypothetical protein [Inquilinus limosus]|uniref:hypothetical protein n=1 Tax=Inquilinus limosus TaxID=171674 RepID=UPI0004206417|nr:hypothetical protein [Inquilinus limosus]
MLKVFRIIPRRAAILAVLGAALAVPLMASTPAEAWWRGGWGWHSGVSIGIGIPLGPRAYYAPPPVYYAPPPVYYAPPPVVYAPPPPPVVYAPPPRVVYAAPPARVWVPGYWSRGIWIEGHWR